MVRSNRVREAMRPVPSDPGSLAWVVVTKRRDKGVPKLVKALPAPAEWTRLHHAVAEVLRAARMWYFGGYGGWDDYSKDDRGDKRYWLHELRQAVFAWAEQHGCAHEEPNLVSSADISSMCALYDSKEMAERVLALKPEDERAYYEVRPVIVYFAEDFPE